jgi:hypothetical protein
MSLEHRGFVGVFEAPLTQERVQEIVALWLDRYGKVEQASGNSYQVLTTAIRTIEDLIWEKNLQFRVICDDQFTWTYITMDRFVIETSGLDMTDNGNLLCHDVLSELPGCEEIIDERNDSRLDELEKLGLM